MINPSAPRSELVAQLLFRVILALYVSTLVVLEVYYIMPVLFSGRGDVYATYFLVGIYLLTGFVYNAIQIVCKDPSIRGVMLVNKVTREWTYCTSCQTPRPPRAHHCHVCNTCIIRRDHHCVLLAQCIGLANWRHFFSMLVFGALGAILATRFNLDYVFGDHFVTNDWSVSFRLLCMLAPPGLLWILREISLWQTLIFTLTTTCLLFGCLMLSFTCYYLHMMFHNQTMSDRAARSKALAVDPSSRTTETNIILNNTGANLYDIGWKANTCQYLGRQWIRAIFVPFIPCSPTTDGLSFPRSEDIKFR